MVSVRIDLIHPVNAAPVDVSRHQLRHVDRTGGGVRLRCGRRVATVHLAGPTERLLAGDDSLLLALLAAHEVTVPALVWNIFRPLRTENIVSLSREDRPNYLLKLVILTFLLLG